MRNRIYVVGGALFVVLTMFLSAFPTAAASSPQGTPLLSPEARFDPPTVNCGAQPPTYAGTERPNGISTSMLWITENQLPCNMPSLPPGTRPSAVGPQSGSPTRGFQIYWWMPTDTWLYKPDGSNPGYPDPSCTNHLVTITGHLYGWDASNNVRPLSWFSVWVFDVDLDSSGNPMLVTIGYTLVADDGSFSVGPVCNTDGSGAGTRDIIVAVAAMSSAGDTLRYFCSYPIGCAAWVFWPFAYTAWTGQFNNVPDGTFSIGYYLVPQPSVVGAGFRLYSPWSGFMMGWDMTTNRLSPSYSAPQAEVHFLAPCLALDNYYCAQNLGEPFPHYMVSGAKCGWTHTSGDPPLASDCDAHWNDFSWQIHFSNVLDSYFPFVINHLYAHYVMQRLGGGSYPSNGATPAASSRFAGDFDENADCDVPAGSPTSYELYCKNRYSIFYSDLDGTYQYGIAWAEGWADYFALRAIGGGSTLTFHRSPNDPDCSGCSWILELEPTSSKWGAFVEFNIIGSMNDLFDTASDHLDTVSLSQSDIWNPFRAKYSATIFDYWTQFKSTFASDVNKIQLSRLAVFNNNIDLVADLRLTTNTATSVAPVVAAEGSYYHVVWSDGRDGNNEIYYKKVDSNWNVVVGDTRLTSDKADSISPAVAIGPSGRIDVLWSDNRDRNYEIYKRTYTPAAGWGPETRLTNTAPDSKDPDVAFDAAGNAQYVWREVQRTRKAETETIQYSKNGGTPTTLYSVVGNPYSGSHTDRLLSPGIAAGGTNYLHVVWSKGPAWPVEPGTTYLYYRRWNGASWDATVTLGTDVDAPRRIRVDASAGIVVAVWDQWQDGFDISYRTSSNYGATWAAETVLSASGNQYAPDVTIIAGSDSWFLSYADNSRGQYEITAYAHYKFLGIWLDVSFPRSDAPGDSLYPRMTYSTTTGQFGIAWQDMRDGNWEIYWSAINFLFLLGN